MRKCNECDEEREDEKLCYDKEQNFYLCELCYCTEYCDRMKHLLRLPGASYSNLYQAAQATFLMTKKKNPLPKLDIQEKDTEGTPPHPQQ